MREEGIALQGTGTTGRERNPFRRSMQYSPNDDILPKVKARRRLVGSPRKSAALEESPGLDSARSDADFARSSANVAVLEPILRRTR